MQTEVKNILNLSLYLDLFIRSLIFSIIMIVSSAFHSILCICAAPLPLYLRYRITRLWMIAIIKLGRSLCRLDYCIQGWENVIKIKNGIILSKHQSAWETIFLASIFDQVAIVIKNTLLWLPFFGWGLALLKPISINRNKGRAAMQEIIQQGKLCLKAGRWVLIFPEGTRVASGQIGRYRLGGTKLAVETGYPIIPVAHNAGQYWPKRQFIKKPGLIRIIFGPPIYPDGKTPEELLIVVKNWIEETMLYIDSL